MKGVKVSEENWSDILKRVKDGERVTEVAAEFGISTKTIYNRLSSKTNTDSSALEMSRLRRENKALKELVGKITLDLSKKKRDLVEKYLCKTLNKTFLTELVQISRSSIYYDHKLPARDLEFFSTVVTVMKQDPAYGTERIALNLSVSKQKVHRIKQKFNLYPIKSKRKPKKKRDLGKDHSSHSNLIKDLTVIAPRTVYASDFTYIPFEGKFVYLATVIDLFTREIVGWQVSRRHTASMIKEALLDSIQRTGQTPDLIHSDQGIEYKLNTNQKSIKTF